MTRLWILLAALSFSLSAAADNVLMKANGLGAAALGGLSLSVGAAALSDPPAWQGYPKGDGLLGTDDASGRGASGCAATDGGAVAKALKGEAPPSGGAAAETAGQIRFTDPDRQKGAQIFDSKAIYDAGGQPSVCPSP